MTTFEAIAGVEQHDVRLDKAIADLIRDVSRSDIQRDILAGRVRVNGQTVTQRSLRLREGDRILWDVASKPALNPQPLELQILHEDADLVAIDKPAGLVVHPGAGTKETTLVEALLVDRQLPPTDDPSRPGVVHRIDKETSGVLLVAKTPDALARLQAQFARRSISKTYLAVVDGIVAEEEGWIDAPVGRDPRMPSRMAIHPGGRESQTGFAVLQRMADATILVVRPRTGRTHQIRVHCQFIKHPVVGDPIYGTRSSRNQAKQHTLLERDPCSDGAGGDPIYGTRSSKNQAKQHTLLERDPCSNENGIRGSRDQAEAAGVAQTRSASAERPRMLLHAWRLAFDHPRTGELMQIEAPIPSEFPRAPYEGVPWIAIPERK